MVFDALNRVTSVTDPNSNAKTYTYDESSNVLTVTDALTHKTTFTYDELGQRLTMVDPAAKTTTWGWNLSGRLLTLKDANNNLTQYGYDKIGRLTSIVYPDLKSESRSYNGDGTVATATDPNGSVATFTYDPDDQVKRVDYTKGTGVVGLTFESFVYDKLGRMTSSSTDAGVSSASHATSRTYDSLDRALTDVADSRTITRTFDTVGNPLTTTNPGSRKFVRTFDGLNRIIKIEEDVSGTKRTIRQFDYLGVDRLFHETGPLSRVATFGYDNGRRLTGITATDGTNNFLNYALGWANDDVPTYVSRLHDTGPLGDVFTHDADHRLTAAGLSQTNPTGALNGTQNGEVFAIGPVHERTSETLTLGGTATVKSTTRNLRYGYTNYGGVTRTYDNSGNLTGRGTETFQWDAKNRLAVANLAGGIKLEFGYDTLGRRVEKKKTVSGVSTTTTYVYDGWNTVQEIVGINIFRESVYGAALDSAVEYRIFGTPNHDYEIYRDNTGSSAAVVSDSGTTQLFKYLPFGKASKLTPGTATYDFSLTGTTNSSLWEGLDLDPDLGWYFARNRWYDPDTGSFVSADPLGYPDSANTYAWGVANSFARDPEGLCDDLPCFKDRIKGNFQKAVGFAKKAWFGTYEGVSTGVSAYFNAMWSTEKIVLSVPVSAVKGSVQQVKDLRKAEYIIGNKDKFSLADLRWARRQETKAGLQLALVAFTQGMAAEAEAGVQSGVAAEVRGIAAESEGLETTLVRRALPAASMDDVIAANYQRYINEAAEAVVNQFNRGEIKIPAGQSWQVALGQRIDAAARGRLLDFLKEQGVAEGPGTDVLVNRRLMDPSGSGRYRIPDLRLIKSRRILDGTIGSKTLDGSQAQEFETFSGGDTVELVRPQSGPLSKPR
jgi:RHS repeat-associated protein